MKKCQVLADAIYPMFVNMPLDQPQGGDGDGTGSGELNTVKWKHEEAGWTLLKAVPDSGATVSVGPVDMADKYEVKETPASKSGKGFTSASKHSIPNVGEMDLPIQSPEGLWNRHRFQCTPKGSVARPLFSIGQECDAGHLVVFGSNGGAIVNKESGAVRRFPRLESGAYEIDLWVPPHDLIERAKQEMGFPRQSP